MKVQDVTPRVVDKYIQTLQKTPAVNTLSLIHIFLLTQLYGMIMVLNLFGIVVAACMIYNMEFKGSAVKKMYMLPVSVPAMYLCNFLILTAVSYTHLDVYKRQVPLCAA